MRRLAPTACLALALAAPLAAAAHPAGPGRMVLLEPPDLAEAHARAARLERREPPAREGDLEQTMVVPERPGQNQVAWYRFDWQYVDLPAPDGGKGGLRLYYYRSAAAQARRALPAIRSAYARLVAEFAYSPTRRIPFILYGTQREFQTSNVFEVSESVLGVTSPQDLKMSVPYFGDHSRFLEVSTHEMVHQFTIQKLLDAAGGDAHASTIQRLPLWFVEGIAEYYTKGGLDAEADEYLRDLVWNPEPARRYQVVSFAEDRARGYLPTYKMGQARIAFIAETYGRDRIQALLENAALAPEGPAAREAKALDAWTRRALGEPVEQVDVRWRAWLKRRYFGAYGHVRQDLPQVRELGGLEAEPEAAVASPDGQVVLVRGIDREKGRARLLLADQRNLKDAATVVWDDTPGSESLHPVDYGVMALGDGVLAYSAQVGEGDALTVQRWSRDEKGRLPRVRLGERRRLEVLAPGGRGFVRIADPAFSPDGRSIAFVGVASDGRQDVYVVPVEGGTARRLTDDVFAERDLAWGPDGIYLSSDATDHGRHNLFRLDPETGARTRLTTWPAEDRHPRPLPSGGLAFSTTGFGKPDLALLEGGGVRPLTDFTTALSWPAPAPGGRGLLAVTFHGGVFRLVEVPKLAFLSDPPVPVAPPAGAVLPVPEEELPPDPIAYAPLRASNWRVEAGMLYGGGSSAGVAGRGALLMADYLRDQALLLDVAVLGSLDYSQLLALYQNRAGRIGWSLGAFHFVQQRLDQDDLALEYLQRDVGVAGTLSFPLDRFRRFEAELVLGGSERYCLTDYGGTTFQDCGGYATRPDEPAPAPAERTAAWQARNGGMAPFLAPALRFGYDAVRLDPMTGPLDGGSALLEVGGGWHPTRRSVHAFTRVELARWWQLAGRANLMARVAGAGTVAPDEAGRRWQRSWWLSAPDNLRGYTPLDVEYLVGRGYLVSNLELQVPLDAVVKLAFLEQIEGVAALDFGGAFNRAESRPVSDVGGCVFATTRQPTRCIDPGAWDARTLTGVLGVNVLLGPILLRVHWGHPFDIGGMLTPALGAGSRWVTNFTIRYFLF